MSLFSCPECQHQISTGAEACPHCGYHVGGGSLGGPPCHACSSPATTRCQCCGALSCVSHVRSVWVSGNKSGGHELRCESCASDAEASNAFGAILIVIVIVVGLFFIISNASTRSKPTPSRFGSGDYLKDMEDAWNRTTINGKSQGPFPYARREH